MKNLSLISVSEFLKWGSTQLHVSSIVTLFEHVLNIHIALNPVSQSLKIEDKKY